MSTIATTPPLPPLPAMRTEQKDDTFAAATVTGKKIGVFDSLKAAAGAAGNGVAS